MKNDKKNIINRFYNKVKGVRIVVNNINSHSGKEGFFLERKMGIKHNSYNKPDLYGYEMKKSSNCKITLGDFNASQYAFSVEGKRDIINRVNKWNDDIIITRNQFIRYFGNPNINKRYSWSISSCPKYNIWNDNGQILTVLNNNDIAIYYSYRKDKRIRKMYFPWFLKKQLTLIAIWKSDKLKHNIEDKYNVNGFFICKKINDLYENICFGKPFNFKCFINGIKNRSIVFDRGLREYNRRNYSLFRGYSRFWDKLITDVH